MGASVIWSCQLVVPAPPEGLPELHGGDDTMTAVRGSPRFDTLPTLPCIGYAVPEDLPL